MLDRDAKTEREEYRELVAGEKFEAQENEKMEQQIAKENEAGEKFVA